jgi:hypothetical protein
MGVKFVNNQLFTFYGYNANSTIDVEERIRVCLQI